MGRYGVATQTRSRRRLFRDLSDLGDSGGASALAGGKGTRISVELIVELLADGWTRDQLVDSYPPITVDDIRACLAYASDVLHSEKV